MLFLDTAIWILCPARAQLVTNRTLQFFTSVRISSQKSAREIHLS
jgi:hypothetical protein